MHSNPNVESVYSRFQFRGLIDLPTLEDRIDILKREIKKESSICRLHEAQLRHLGDLTSFYSCRGLVDVISVAIRRKYSEDKKSSHFISGLDTQGQEVFHATAPQCCKSTYHEEIDKVEDFFAMFSHESP